MGPGMRQVVGFGDQSIGGYILLAYMVCPIVINGEFEA